MRRQYVVLALDAVIIASSACALPIQLAIADPNNMTCETISPLKVQCDDIGEEICANYKTEDACEPNGMGASCVYCNANDDILGSYCIPSEGANCKTSNGNSADCGYFSHQYAGNCNYTSNCACVNEQDSGKNCANNFDYSACDPKNQ